MIHAYLVSRRSPLAPYTGEIMRASRRYGVDPRLLVAIAGAETSYATNPAAGQDITTGHNAWGMGPHIQYPSWEAGIDATARNLRTGYLDQGLRSVPAIGRKWAPLGAANDPNWLNTGWAGNVTTVLERLGGAGGYVGPGQVPFGTGSGRSASTSGSPADSFALSVLKSLAAGTYNPVESLQVATRVPAPSRRTGLSPRAPNRVTQKVLDIANAQVGKPYVWGAESPAEGGFDCSGLIDYAFRQAGVNLPPGRLTTWTMAKLGRSVKGKPLRPGDWVITNGGKHVVLYVGGGKVLAAPHPGAVVQYQDFDSFKGGIVDIRRVLGG